MRKNSKEMPVAVEEKEAKDTQSSNEQNFKEQISDMSNYSQKDAKQPSVIEDKEAMNEAEKE